MKRWFKYFFLLILTAALVGGYCLCFTETGFKIGVSYISSLIPSLKIAEAQGKLFSDFSLKNVSYQNDNHNIIVKSMQIKWDPILLLWGKLFIKKITLNQAHIIIKKTSTQSINRSYFAGLHNIIIHQFIVNQLVLQNENAQLHFNGELTTHWNATWKIDIKQFNSFFSDLNGTLISHGRMSGPALTPLIHATLEANDINYKNQYIKKIEGQALINFASGSQSNLILTGHHIKFKNLNLPKLDIQAHASVTQKLHSLEAHLHALIMQKNSIHAFLSLPHFTNVLDLTQPVEGKFSIDSTQLDFLTTWLSEIHSPKGMMKGNLNIKGTLDKPQLTGSFDLINGHIDIPKLGIHLNNISLKAENILAEQIHYIGSLQSGSGQAHFQGLIDTTDSDFPITMTLQGKELEIMNLPEYKIIASPTLQLSFKNNDLQIQGHLLIPSADISPKSFTSVVSLPNDVVFVEENKKRSSLPFATTLQINLVLGNHIQVNYNELKTHLRGKLQINQSPTSLPTATGELYAVDGTYRAYGKILSIQEGRLLFAETPLFNPGLNIRAAKQIKTIAVNNISQFENKTGLTPISLGTETVTAGVQILGSFDKPIVSLFSTPAGLGQRDILSYLIFGHPQSQISGKQTGALLNAVSLLNSSGNSRLGNITENIQDKLGLSELNVESTEVFNPTSGSSSSTTALVVGKQLAPNLYMHYSMGIFDPIKILNMRYQLSKRFAIQSETSTMGNGADLLYGIERD